MMTAKKRAALFDLDGVLVDTESIYTDFWNHIDNMYPTGVKNFALVIKGNTLGNILNTYYPDAGLQQAIIEQLREHERTMRYVPFDGVETFLRTLKSAGIPAAIVTSSNAVKMQNMFEQLPGFRNYFDAVITEENVERSKPDPDGYLKAAEALGCAPEDCYVFEDSLAGLEAGRRAKATVIGLATTNPRDVIEGRADIIVGSLSELCLSADGCITSRCQVHCV